MPKILIIDDDADLSGMLTEYLAGEGFATETAPNGEAGVKAAGTGFFDAIILDIMLPDVSGIEVLRRLRQISAVPVIMLTAKGSDVDRVVGLEMGADDYIAKPYYPRELVARLRAVLRRQPAVRQVADIFTLGGLKLNTAQRDVRWAGTAFELTLSEFDMLAALMRAGDAVANKDDLSLAVLGRPRESYDRSVDVHVSNLRKKLGGVSDGHLEIETVRGVGYRLRMLA